MLDLIVKEAAEHIGLKEILGPVHNQQIVGWFAELGCAWFTADEVAWCAIYVNITLKRRSLPHFTGEKAPRAVCFETYGTEVSFADARPGDIVVFDREGGKHVGFFFGWGHEGKTLFVLGGNQGNSCCIVSMRVDNLTAIRRVPAIAVNDLQVPAYPLAKVHEFKQLQTVLAFTGHYKKIIDGVWGPGTKEAVIAYQKANGLPPTGEYSTAMRSKLFSQLNA